MSMNLGLVTHCGSTTSKIINSQMMPLLSYSMKNYIIGGTQETNNISNPILPNTHGVFNFLDIELHCLNQST